MKKFLKTTLASFIGASIALLIAILIIVGIFSVMISQNEKVVTVKNNSVLVMKLNYSIPDKASENPLENFSPLNFSIPDKVLGLDKILANIKRAKTDKKIKGIYLNLTEISGSFGGMATIEEIRNELINFKESGKFIVAYTNMGFSQKSYYLATVANKIYMNPEAMMMFVGMGGEMTFYKGAFAKLGVKPQVIRVGTYKAAVEPYILDKMSKANREQTMKYIGGIWNHLLEGIAKERKISVQKLNALADNIEVITAKDCLKNKFIDQIIYEDEMIDKLKELTGIKKKKKLKSISLDDYNLAPNLNKTLPDVKNKIAVIYAAGAIGMKQSSTSIGPGLVSDIRKARKDTTVKAIVLRVNSPGGSALVSDLIWREIVLAKKEKPVIASMGNVAASGGYYISCAADTIVASPNTITGSIGIFGLFFSGEKLIKEKLGISTDAFGTNKHASFGGGYPLPLPLASRSFNDKEKQVLQKFINKGYQTFIGKVAKGRSTTKEAINKVGQGRVWTGIDAKANGLVDVLGGLDKAIEIARKKAGLKDNCKIISLPKQDVSPLFQLLDGVTTSFKTKALKSEFGVNYKYYKQVKEILNTNGIQAKMPNVFIK